MEMINWEICFLCKVEKKEKLITPKNEGFETLKRGLNSLNMVFYHRLWIEYFMDQ